MKKLVLFLFICTFCIFSVAQTTAPTNESNADAVATETNEKQKRNDKQAKAELKTLIKGKPSHGGFGALSFKYTKWDDEDALLVGGRLGWVINHSFSIGFGGYGLVNDLQFGEVVPDMDLSLYGGYGGLYLEPILFPRSPVHVTIPVLIGAGAVAYANDYIDLNGEWNEIDELHDLEVFYVVEPGLNVEFSLLKFMRLDVGASYRYFFDMDNLVNTKSDAFNGFSAGVTLKFGRF